MTCFTENVLYVKNTVCAITNTMWDKLAMHGGKGTGCKQEVLYPDIVNCHASTLDGNHRTGTTEIVQAIKSV